MRWNFVRYKCHECMERMASIGRKSSRVLGHLWNIKSSRRKLIAIPLSVIGLGLIYSWSSSSNSSALNALLCLVTFDVLILLGDLLSNGIQHGGKQSTSFAFGEARIEVLIHFSILCFVIMLNLWVIFLACDLILKRSIDDVKIDWFLPASLIGGIIHFFLSFNNNPLHKVYKIANTQTFLQTQFESFSSLGPKFSLLAQSPLGILGVFVVLILIGLNFLLTPGAVWIDFIGGVVIALGTLDATYPLWLYTGQVLLQIVPPDVAAQLDQALREALTIDGVLEFRNELFWVLSYGQLAGMLHVRVRRDAHEQLVLAKLYEKIQVLVPHLTIQITKDDFSRRVSQFPVHRDTNSPPPVIVTINHGNDLSPIPRGPDASKHVIYSTASSSSSGAFKGLLNHSTVPLHSYAPDDTLLNISSSSSIFHPDTSPPLSTTVYTNMETTLPPNALFRPISQKNHLLRNNFDPTEGRESFVLDIK